MTLRTSDGPRRSEGHLQWNSIRFAVLQGIGCALAEGAVLEHSSAVRNRAHSLLRSRFGVLPKLSSQERFRFPAGLRNARTSYTAKGPESSRASEAFPLSDESSGNFHLEEVERPSHYGGRRHTECQLEGCLYSFRDLPPGQRHRAHEDLPPTTRGRCPDDGQDASAAR
jgi:hypothetical protein